ncbi:hypothetical protein HDU93_010001 [Gonapodya sp. JEL0774]|nr:hypothetical protein HDU93_010001 [Gonapodya sp. JEL0774]
MADPIGIASSIAGIFSTCVEVLNKIQIARQFGRDFETHLVTLALVANRLSRWGDGVRIYEKDGPTFGNTTAPPNPQEQALVKRALDQIFELLAASEKVARGYELKGEDMSPVSTKDTTTPRLAAVNLTLRNIVKRRQKSAGLGQLASWALRDKACLDDLVNGLTGLLDELEKSFPAPQQLQEAAKINAADVKEVVAAATAAVPGAQSEDPQVAQVLRLVQELAEKVDKPLSKELASSVVNRGINIKKQEVKDRARLRDGDTVTDAWRGQVLPQISGGSINIGEQIISGDARVQVGNSFVGERDTFFD